MKAKRKAYIYLLHFSQPVSHAHHYLGWTVNLPNRMATHRSGNGARLVDHLQRQGGTFELARHWEVPFKDAREIERRMKRRHNSPRLCPICNPDTCDRIKGAVL